MNIVYIDAGGVCADSYMYRYYGDLVREMKQIVKVHHCEDFLSNPDITNLGSFVDCLKCKYLFLVYYISRKTC